MFATVRYLMREHERERRQWERERAQLVDTVCRLAGKPAPAADTLEPMFPAGDYEFADSALDLEPED